jgi:hypothetical protein
MEWVRSGSGVKRMSRWRKKREVVVAVAKDEEQHQQSPKQSVPFGRRCC